MKNKKIAIIGGGNLGQAIAKGIVNSNIVAASNITVTRRRTHLIQTLKELDIRISSNNIEAATDANIIFLAVKPYQIQQVIEEISPYVQKGTIIISLATGIDALSIEKYFKKELPIFRAMPNTAIAIGESMTCISAHHANQEQEQIVLTLFEQVGQALIIPEELMSSATVLAACGIAYALRFIRAATQGGIEIGFGSNLALQVAAQTVKGAAELLIKAGTHPEEEIDKVTTPRGVTISGLNEMEHQGFSSALIKGVLTSFNKIENGK
ncbi:pyrroline-5-carboxylate reductase [Saccharicrinis fermentans]|uniref:Pyrroline-5-carboxylate reductase n=1 Tax=Saccharicrinis fermentans DSM 9555 = JCM 21142 TaxID=869213 RepID=W7YB63_9BACT|nr:pyrroline-5-carboxylate reductase [Saccharicrinis fermentans]GAF04898.1 pyrroline-5-carboxylate reductase [Saccharicrinis fermentans DSM 9555 = JCM 21142]